MLRPEEAELLASVDYFPNGIGFGLDDRLYVASTYDSRIIAYRIEDGRLVDEQTFVQMDTGHPDGFTFDVDGNPIVCAIDLGPALGAIQTWSVTGEKLDHYVPGDNPKNTNAVLDANGKMTICDVSGNGRYDGHFHSLVSSRWPRGPSRRTRSGGRRGRRCCGRT